MNIRSYLMAAVQQNGLRFALGALGVLLLIDVSSACRIGYQQERLPPQETPANPLTPQTNIPPIPKIDLDALRKNLSEYPDLQVELNASDQSLQQIEELPTPRDITQDALTEELEASRQIDQIGSRIRKLMELQKAARLKAPSSNNPTPANITPPPETGNNPVTPTNPTSNTADANTTSPLGGIETTRILDTPPDQIALADSLFYTGEIDLAINLYQKVLQATPLGGEDHVWIRYQIASCYRRMNKFDEASKILRQIAEGSDTNPIVVNARWWLDTIERKRKLVNSIAVLEQFIKRKSNEINDE